MSPEKILTRIRTVFAQKLRWPPPPSWSLFRILRSRHWCGLFGLLVAAAHPALARR